MGYYIYFLKNAFFTSQYIMSIFPCIWMRHMIDRESCRWEGKEAQFYTSYKRKTLNKAMQKKVKIKKMARGIRVAILKLGKPALKAGHIN